MAANTAKKKTSTKKTSTKKTSTKTAKKKASAKKTAKKTSSTLKRAVQKMPTAIAALLDERELRAAYDARPAYQRNDWLAWIGRAVRDATKQKRIASMLGELAAGHGYMGMKWSPST